jgi:FixJ family two-component response regulator
MKKHAKHPMRGNIFQICCNAASLVMEDDGMEALNGKDEGDKSLAEVVLVDDDTASLVELEEFIIDSGYRCRAYSAPEQALEHIRRRQTPVVLISDVRMPKMSGLELSRISREEDVAACPVEIILYSGHSGFDEAVQSLKYGVVDFLLKPIDPVRLGQTILRATERVANRMTAADRDEKLQDWLSGMMRKAQEILSPCAPADVDAKPPVSAAPLSNVPAAAILTAPRPVPAAAPVPVERGSHLTLIKLIQNNRRSRDRMFPACNGGDPSWEIVLFVLEQEVLQRSVSVTSACHATAIPQTTAMRKIDELVDAGLLARIPDEDDRRRVLLSSTPSCRESARRYFEATLAQLQGTRHILD